MSRTFRYEDYREDSNDDGLTFWNPEDSVYGNLIEIFKRSVYLPEQQTQLPILIAYSFVPSAMCTRLPILFLQGDRGTGKTTACKILAAIQGQKILSAASTFAAVRNYVAQNRWHLPEEQREEKNFCLFFDNVSLKTFSDENLYALFLNGYDRDSDLIQISSGQGTNMVFRVFSPKVFSSVHQLFGDPRLNELTRRILPIKFKQSQHLPDFDSWYETHLELSDLNLSWLHREYNCFWSDEQNLVDFIAHKKSLRKPKNFSPENWAVTHDLIATGLTLGIWKTKHDAIDLFGDYWYWINTWMQGQGAFRQLVKDFIKEQEIFWNAGYPRVINPKEFKARVELWKKEGKIECLVTQELLISLMADLGWYLGKFELELGKPDIFWLPIQ